MIWSFCANPQGPQVRIQIIKNSFYAPLNTTTAQIEISIFYNEIPVLVQTDMTAGERGLFIELVFTSSVHYGLLRCALYLPEWRGVEFLHSDYHLNGVICSIEKGWGWWRSKIKKNHPNKHVLETIAIYSLKTCFNKIAFSLLHGLKNYFPL